MKIVGIVLLSLAIVFLGVKTYSFWRQEEDLNAQLADIEVRLVSAQANEANLASDSQYLANPANLEKEFRSRFNYKKPGETMVVIVSNASSAASSTP
jgi:uncharacterized protein YlxW (UPF0749 family)